MLYYGANAPLPYVSTVITATCLLLWLVAYQMQCHTVELLPSTSLVADDIKNWIPKSKIDAEYESPYDAVPGNYIPHLANGDVYDWTAISGVTMPNNNYTYIMLGGTLANNNKFNPVFSKKAGIIVLCVNSIHSSSKQKSTKDRLNLKCKTIDSSLNKHRRYKMLGMTVKAASYKNKYAAFVYCDPLWVSKLSDYSFPSGQCTLLMVQNNQVVEKRNFKVCSFYRQCVGGFSVDLITHTSGVDILFGLPFANAIKYLRQAQTSQIAEAVRMNGTGYNYGYAVALTTAGNKFVASPTGGKFPAFVELDNKYKIFPADEKYSYYSGFGSSLDTVKLTDKLFGAVIGAPYTSVKGENTGAVYLACRGYPLDRIDATELIGVAEEDKNEIKYFGYAVAQLGDVNSDGTEDFVVTAPNLDIRNNPNSVARVFVLTTTSDCKINRKPAQIISRKPGSSQKSGTGQIYGVAVSRGLDLDNNGWPDFFVTGLGAVKSELFMMPPQVQVKCQSFDKQLMFKMKILLKNEVLELSVKFNIDGSNKNETLDLTKYHYQVAMDYLSSDKPRFNLIDSNVRHIGGTGKDRKYELKIRSKLLKDALDMDMYRTPFRIAIRGVRPCKLKNGPVCFTAGETHATWIGCDRQVFLPQYECPPTNTSCHSDLGLKLQMDRKGSTIYYREQNTYHRRLTVNLYNKGVSSSPRIYLSVKGSEDVTITEIGCSNGSSGGNGTKQRNCRVEMTEGGHSAVLIVRELISSGTTIPVFVKWLYIPPALSDTNRTEFSPYLKMTVWGVNKDPDNSNNKQSIQYSVLMVPQLIISQNTWKSVGAIIDDRSGPSKIRVVKGQRVPVQNVGTPVRFSYLIENKGPSLRNVTFKLKFPYKIQNQNYTTDQTDSTKGILLYLLNKVRLSYTSSWDYMLPEFVRKGTPVGYCKIPNYAINPLDIIAVRNREKSSSKPKQPVKRLKRDATWAEENRRWKRSSADTEEVNKKNESDTETGDKSQNQTVDDTVIIRDKSIPINCWQKAKAIGRPVCVEVTCRLNDIPKNSVFDFDFHTWLFTETFFNNELNDVKVSVKFQSDLGQLPKGLEIVNNQRGVGPVIVTRHILYSQMKVKEKKRVPWWIYIVATVIGVFILAIIISIAYCLGFFKRKQLKKEMKELRAQPNKPESEALVK